MRVDLDKVASINQCPTPTSFIEARSFMGEAQCQRKFIANFSIVATHLHGMTAKGKFFHWHMPQRREYEYLKRRFKNAPILSMHNLQHPFQLEIYANGYALGVVLLQGGRPVRYHFESFHGVALDYPTYDKDLFFHFPNSEEMENYLLRKETIIHIDHQPLQYLQIHIKMQQVRHYQWQGVFQQFNFHMHLKNQKRTQL